MATGYRPPHQLPHEVDEQPNLNPPLITKLHHHQNSIQPLARSYAELLQNKNPSSSKAQPFKPFSIDRATLIKGNFQTKSQFVFGDFDSKYSSPLKPIVDYCGKKAILFQKSDKDRLLSRIQLVLLGKFSHGRPPIYAIKDFFCSLKLKGSYNISLFDYKHLYIECELLEDYIRIWLEKVWIVKGFHMRIFKWCADFKPRNESPIAPIWVHLNGLPLYLFEKEALWSIANVIGNPLLISKDNLNRSNLSCASFCVELDVTKQLLDEIWIEFGKEIIDTKVHSEDKRDGFWQKVEYGYIPKYCTFCAHIDHSLESCKQRYLKCPSESNRRMEEKFIDLAHGSSTATLEHAGVQGFQVLVHNGKVAGRELPVGERVAEVLDSVSREHAAGYYNAGETAVPGIPAEYKETAAHTLTEKSSGSKDQGIEGCRFANNQQTLDAELQQTHEQDRGVQPNMHSDALAKPAMDSAIGESPDAADSVTKIMAAGINAASTRLETNGTAAESVLQYDVSVSAAAAGRGLKNKGVVAELDTGAVAAESAPDPAVFSAPVQNSIDVHEHFGNLECAEFGQNEGEIGGEDNVLLHNQGQKSAGGSAYSDSNQPLDSEDNVEQIEGYVTGLKQINGMLVKGLIETAMSGAVPDCTRDEATLGNDRTEEVECNFNCINNDIAGLLQDRQDKMGSNCIHDDNSGQLANLEEVQLASGISPENTSPQKVGPAALAGCGQNIAVAPGNSLSVQVQGHPGWKQVYGMLVRPFQEATSFAVQESMDGHTNMVQNMGAVEAKTKAATSREAAAGMHVYSAAGYTGNAVTAGAVAEAAGPAALRAAGMDGGSTGQVIHAGKELSSAQELQGVPTTWKNAGNNTKCRNSHTASITPRKLSSVAAEFTPKWAVSVEELVEEEKESDPVLVEEEKTSTSKVFISDFQNIPGRIDFEMIQSILKRPSKKDMNNPLLKQTRTSETTDLGDFCLPLKADSEPSSPASEMEEQDWSTYKRGGRHGKKKGRSAKKKY